MATIEEIRGLIPRVAQLEAKVDRMLPRDGYTYAYRGEVELLRIDAGGKIEILRENSLPIEDGSYQWFAYWAPYEVISYERYQELKAEEERRNQEYRDKQMHHSEIPF